MSSGTDMISDAPEGVAVDAQGNVYIADSRNNRVRRVSVTGTITTVVGRTRGGSGDGGRASAARLYQPIGLAVDGNGDLYVADTYNHRVRKVGDVSVPGLSGRCSKATAIRIAERLRLGNAGFTRYPVGQVLCGAFVGRGSRAMVFSLTVPGCGGTGGWVVFRPTGGSWQLVLNRNNGAVLAAVRSDVRETMSILRPGDAHCFPSGGTRSRVWHWNGSPFTVTPWKVTAPKK